ncbi:TraR/DksA C4-type zinc finger protein [Luteimicrobium xylanilyticum]|uniref:General stress protein 16O n=1 Tax=Luteimicrobium xylanilyticum TaxID=1133546 RepID=A0A5P9QEH0_9MICO|nr:TraR/DksA C4-type zinc finger protein [Luteimicrobium xylanilyticum]QFU99878.1 General stress protein 16O [Luteimicrobium xylanilyticum]
MDEARVRARLDELRREAAARLAALDGQLSDIADARRDANSDDEHDPEGSTLAFDRAQVSTLAAGAHRRLDEIDAAIARLDDGTYGRCERCGQPVPEARLAARPTARFCVGCQARVDANDR